MTPVAGRRVTTAVTLGVLVLVLCGMAVWGWKHVTAPLDGQQASSQETCSPAETTRVDYVRPRDVQVSVYNAGTNGGLAGRTMNRLENRGFQPGVVENAPAGMHVRRAVVHTTKKDNPAAELVARQLGKHVQVVVTGAAAGPGIDVYVGDRFHKLAKHAPQKVKLPRPRKQCISVQ